MTADTPGVCDVWEMRTHARRIGSANRSAPGVLYLTTGTQYRGLASRGLNTKGLPVESIRRTSNPAPYPSVIARSGVSA